MSRFEISYEVNGRSGSMFVVERTAELAIQKFKEEWSATESTVPECWVTGSWGIE